jgi:outer membrane lipoprotein-sorting protein
MAGAAARADERSDAVIARYKALAAKSTTMSADVALTMTVGGEKQSLTVRTRARKPASVDLTLIGPGNEKLQRMISNGKTGWMIMEAQKQYMKAPRPMDSAGLQGLVGLPVAAFLKPASLTDGRNWTYVGAQPRNGKSYTVLSFKTAGEPSMEGKVYFDATGLLVGMDQTVKAGQQSIQQSFWLKNVKLNVPLTAQSFAFTPPAGYQKFEEPDYDKSLLAVGATAPEFQLARPGGEHLALSDSLKGKKAVLVNFWFYG